MRGKPDLPLLGVDGCPLLPGRVRTGTCSTPAVTPAGAMVGGTILIFNTHLCVFTRPSAATKARRLSVILGKSALNETVPYSEQAFRVDEVFVHEAFDNSDGNYNNDIGRISYDILRYFFLLFEFEFLMICFSPALLRLKGRPGQCANETRTVRTVCLPPPGDRLQSGIQCEIAGYGKEQQGALPTSSMHIYSYRTWPICEQLS